MRGRPAGQMTERRRQVASYWQQHGPVPVMRAAEDLGLPRFEFRRILRDCWRYDLICHYAPAE